ncbi:MAG: hypothetical protein QY331_10670 [Melioribacteraceae bacterium]|jgi:hypothetical protein|nr:MAG: hypothetical protein QY331_10670 [Melioribacteraceae bacterium]
MKKLIAYLKEEPNKNGVKRWEFYASIVFAVIAIFFLMAIIYTVLSKVI